MEKTKEIPPIVKIGAWLLSLIVFSVGFWHTHLGLKEMRPFGSEYGSIAIASIILLLLLITYYFAVSGNKTALIFYVICGIFFFVFNMNYFYPAYLGRQLVKEEATALNDTLQTYANRGNGLLNDMGFKNKDGSLSDYLDMIRLKDIIITEIKELKGVGPNANKALNDFYRVASKHGIQTRINYQSDAIADAKMATFYETGLEAVIKDFLINSTSKGSNLANASNFVVGVGLLDSLQKTYTPILKNKIIPDNSDIKIEDVKNNTQILTLQNLVTGLDEASSKINEAAKKTYFQLMKEAKTRNLGRIAHTVKSVFERLNKIDTWAIILVCLFIDLLVPLAIYTLLRKKADDVDKTQSPLGPQIF
jgi:hypothetical protein